MVKCEWQLLVQETRIRLRSCLGSRYLIRESLSNTVSIDLFCHWSLVDRRETLSIENMLRNANRTNLVQDVHSK